MFTKHNGKSIPLPIGTNVTIKHRSGKEHNYHVAAYDRWIWDYKWGEKKMPGDIVGYINRDVK